MMDRENRESDQNEAQLNMPLSAGGDQQAQEAAPPKGRGRGFASMDKEKQREIASKGGKAAHAKGTAHEFSSQEARDAGRKGGQARGKNNRSH